VSEMLDKSIGTEGKVYGRLEHGDCVRIANTGEGAIVSMLKFMSEQRHELYEHRERLLADKGTLCDAVADLERQLAEANRQIEAMKCCENCDNGPFKACYAFSGIARECKCYSKWILLTEETLKHRREA
jgi:hypothetical protein